MNCHTTSDTKIRFTISPLPYRFDLEDVRWLDHLRSAGYVVIKSVADTEEATAAYKLLERDLTSLRLPATGLIAKLAQSEGAWSVRGVPTVKETFAKIWETDDLIVSMDAVIAWRAWQGHNSSTNTKGKACASPPRTEGLHLDQNPFSKQYLDCIQGMMPLLPVTEETGGLEVVPFSHCDESKIIFRARYPTMSGIGDWCPLSAGDPMYKDAILLLAEPGDLILWDSRTVHGGRVGTAVKITGGDGRNDKFVNGDFKNNTRDTAVATTAVDETTATTTKPPLVRLSVCVAMTPRSKATDAVLKARKDGFRKGVSFNHCPHEAGTSSGTIHALLPKGCQRANLTDWQRSLL